MIQFDDLIQFSITTLNSRRPPKFRDTFHFSFSTPVLIHDFEIHKN